MSSFSKNDQSVFRFQQFEIRHDRCAMKVGTDGVLLGAWVGCSYSERILDVGTGSGLIAMMLAQRNSNAQILGIDIDAEAVGQAQENFERSPFAHRLSAKRVDFAQGPFVASLQSFDLIVSNPPFFTEDTVAPDSARATARSSSSLPFDVLIEHAAKLLSPQGHFAVIIPHSHAADFVLTASVVGLHLLRRCDVQTSPRKPMRRAMLEFGMETGQTTFETICLHNADGTISDAYRKLTADFYLNIK